MARSVLAGFAAALLVPLLLAACEQDESEDGDLFMRDVPEGVAPLEPAPELADVRPVPDLNADEKALAMICAAGAGLDGETCGCIAAATEIGFDDRDLAYFAARLTGNESEATRVENGLPDDLRAEMTGAYARIMAECGR